MKPAYLIVTDKKSFAFESPYGYYASPAALAYFILTAGASQLPTQDTPSVFRIFLLASLLLLVSIPASGMKTELYRLPGDTLTSAAGQLRAGNYSGAKNLASNAPAGGARDFISGVASFRNMEWEQAASDFSSAAESFGLLADYALYFQAQSLNSLKKYDEALSALLTLLKLYPETPVKRLALLLTADLQYSRKDFKGSISAYQKFIETYPSGSDSLTSQFRIALCRDALGEPAAAVKVLRNLWLTSPASPLADMAEKELKRISASGTVPSPYTPDELFRRASTLFDLKKFPHALASFREIPRDGQSRDFLERIDLRTAQALYRNRSYRDAETIFSKTASQSKDPAHAAEGTYWVARCRDKNDRHEEAVLTFLQVVDRWPKSNEADNSLLEAALIRKSEQRWSDVLALVQRLLSEYPDTSLKKQAWWEGGWSAYKSGNLQAARIYFGKLAESDSGRDRALYWLARTDAAAGDEKSAQTSYATLLRDFPASYYSLSQSDKDTVTAAAAKTPAKIDIETLENLPLPANHERIRALITFGLTEEAKKELGSIKIKPNDSARLLGIARLYIEINDYNGAFNLIKRESSRFTFRDQNQLMALQYPLPFMENAVKQAGVNKLSLPLIYAVIRAESAFSPVAVSPAGAVGLMQLMPATAAMIEGSGKKSFPSDKLKQPELNIRFGTRHMKDLIDQYSNNLISVVASYNAGSGSVNRWLKSYGNLPDDEFIEQIPYAETRDYVKQVFASAAIYSRLYTLPLNGARLPLPRNPAHTP